MLHGQNPTTKFPGSVGTVLMCCAVSSALFAPLPQTSSSSPGCEHPQAPPRLPLPRQVFTLMLFTANTAHRTRCCAEGSCQYFACQDKEENALLLYWSHHRAQSCVIAPSFLPHISPQCTSVTQMLLSILSLAEGLTVHRKYPMVDADKM